MKDTFIVLLTAHLVGDFIFQNERLVKAKQKSFRYFLLHMVLIIIATLFIAGNFEKHAIWAYLGVFVSHFVIDSIKRIIKSYGFFIFIFDQTAHLVALFVISTLAPDIAIKSMWLKLFLINDYRWVLIFISGLVLCVPVGSIVISKATKTLVEQIKDKESNGLKNGGKTIGQLERMLTFFFVLTSQVSAIGFLFAAKSILRFGEIKDKDKRMEAEYIIIGTFMSFGWALIVSYLTNKALTLW